MMNLNPAQTLELLQNAIAGVLVIVFIVVVAHVLLCEIRSRYNG